MHPATDTPWARLDTHVVKMFRRDVHNMNWLGPLRSPPMPPSCHSTSEDAIGVGQHKVESRHKSAYISGSMSPLILVNFYIEVLAMQWWDSHKWNIQIKYIGWQPDQCRLLWAKHPVDLALCPQTVRQSSWCLVASRLTWELAWGWAHCACEWGICHQTCANKKNWDHPLCSWRAHVDVLG